MNSRIDDALRPQEQAFKLRAQRQALIASNIAHADTPNFKTIDFDFAASLKQALANQSNPGTPAMTHPKHVPIPHGAAAAIAVTARPPNLASADGNTVDMDRERTEFAANALKLEAALRTLNSEMKMLLAAIQG
jgi:flagellar basal-body rod protein FlgB